MANPPVKSKRQSPTAAETRAVAKQDSYDLSEAANRLRPADGKHVNELAIWYNDRPLPVALRLEREAGNKWTSTHPGDEAEQIISRLRLHRAFGSMSQPFIDTIMGELLTIWDANGGVSEKNYNAALAVLEAAAPENELEAMLVVQMIAANEAALRATSMIGNSGTTEGALGFGNLANKCMRTYAAQLEALTKLRRGGEQIVKYIHVHEGGQAVVAGTINQHRRGVNAETAEQPCGQPGDAPVAALPCKDASRDGVPVPRDAERQMSHSRRKKSGRSERQ